MDNRESLDEKSELLQAIKELKGDYKQTADRLENSISIIESRMSAIDAKLGSVAEKGEEGYRTLNRKISEIQDEYEGLRLGASAFFMAGGTKGVRLMQGYESSADSTMPVPMVPAHYRKLVQTD